jgi:tRNA threonylcarbamoyladenosine biosynthesis protein TsaB
MSECIYILALETSTQLGSVCLLRNDTLISERRSKNQKAHSDFLNQAVDEILSENSLTLRQIDLFATGIGPGSFTGIRIALNAAKTYSYIFKKPVVVSDSLTLLARNTLNLERPVLTLINAYKNMTYTSVFQYKGSQWHQLREPEAVRVNELSAWLKASPLTRDLGSMQVLGDGYETYLPFFELSLLERLERPSVAQGPVESVAFDFPLASTLGQLAYSMFNERQTIDWKLLKPLYIRASEAEETKRGFVFTPLK